MIVNLCLDTTASDLLRFYQRVSDWYFSVVFQEYKEKKKTSICTVQAVKMLYLFICVAFRKANKIYF